MYQSDPNLLSPPNFPSEADSPETPVVTGRMRGFRIKELVGSGYTLEAAKLQAKQEIP
jgi:hypothetical protein